MLDVLQIGIRIIAMGMVLAAVAGCFGLVLIDNNHHKDNVRKA